MPLVIFETLVLSSGGLYQLYYTSLGKITRVAKGPSELTAVRHMELLYSFTYTGLFRVHGELKELIMLDQRSCMLRVPNGKLSSPGEPRQIPNRHVLWIEVHKGAVGHKLKISPNSLSK